MKNLDLIIRPANISDVENIYQILLKSFNPYKNYYPEEAFNATVVPIDKSDILTRHECRGFL
jgi:hypothetical protein